MSEHDGDDTHRAILRAMSSEPFIPLQCRFTEDEQKACQAGAKAILRVAELEAEIARLLDALNKIAYSGTDCPPGMLREEFDHIQHRQCIGIAANALIGK